MVGHRFRTALMGWGITVPLALLTVVASEVTAQSGVKLAADRVAVLRFQNISGVATDDWLGAGIAESVTAGLNSEAGGVRVGGGGLLAATRIQTGAPEDQVGELQVGPGRR